jgi:hypothetical protein
VEQTQERIGADRHASFARQPSAALTAGLQCEGGQQFGRIIRASGVAGEHAIEALGKDLASAIWHIAEPPTAVDSEPHGVATPRQIEWTPLIVTVLPSTQLATLGARNGLARGFGNQHQTPIALDNDQDDAPVLTLPAQRPDHRHLPSMPTLA